ncbi:MATE family efflux transporter [Bradyrhizobium sp. CW7]|uniref:MATE family efflux transporter n=1 Tax=Bradyrhizobium sp. CW7 TaxID=2782688 RepID=UPI001FFB3703|nr:MATE family efflux transporter [Bradyrhizobium sp. CW7]MCK1349589.1 MATE family efflux transporter [Bradyrhizobium sp. CW7]
MPCLRITQLRKIIWAADRHFAVELSEIAKLALPMVLTQLGQVAMMTTDLALIGRSGADAIAAAALAGRVYLVSLIFGMGLVAASASFAAQAFGADNLNVVRRSVRMGLWMALLLSIPIIVFQLRGEPMLLALGQPPDAARLAQQYLSGVAWGAAPVLSFLAIRTFMSAVNRPEPILWITLTAIPLNALLVYLMMYGKLGLPQLDLFGAGLATTLVNCATFSAGLWYATMRRPFRDYRVLAQLWRFDWPLMRQLIMMGGPISMASLLECGIWSAAALLMGWISTKALAATQVAFQIGAILLMIPSGIGMAATVRVAHAVGRNDRPGIKRTGVAAILLGIVIVAVLMVVLIAARFEIADFFLGKSVDDVEATIGLAAHLIFVSASAFMSATVYTIASGSLRGLKDTRVPLLFSGIAYWLIGLSLSYLLGFKSGLGATGVWIGLSIGSAFYAALLVLRFQLLASKLAHHG